MIFESYKDQLFAKTEIAFNRSVQECVGGARRDAPKGMTGSAGSNRGQLQGGLAASIHAERTERQPGRLRTRFGSSLRHAAMREFGGTIRPVRRKALSWIDPQTGRRIVLGPTIKKTHFDPKTNTMFVAKPSVTQQPGGVRNGRKPYLRPNGKLFPRYMTEHLRSLNR